MSDAISTIGAAGVQTVGTLAVTGMAVKAIGKASHFGGGGRGKRRSSSGGKRRKGRKSSKGYNVWG